MSVVREPQQLIDHITPNIDGILWISREHLTERPWPFNELDYICNGQLTKLLLQLEAKDLTDKEKEYPQFISTQQFGAPFFICQIQARDEKKTLDALKQILEIQLPHLSSNGGTVLLVDTTKGPFEQKLKKAFSGIEFKGLKTEELKFWAT